MIIGLERFYKMIVLFNRFVGINEICVEYIQFEGVDYDIMGLIYGVFILVSIVFFDDRDVIVVYEMNGVFILCDYGFFV